MRCKNVEIYLSELIDGKLDDTWQIKVSDHLEKCPSCRAKFDKLQNYKHVVSKVESQDVPDKLKSAIWESIESEKKVARSRKSWTIKPAQSIIISALAASILLLIILKPFSTNIIMDSSYSFVVEKQGKGPAVERVYKKGGDPRVDRVLAIADSAGVEDTLPIINKKSGQVEGINLKIPVENYPKFRKIYNSEKGAISLSELPLDYKRKYIKLQVYIPGRMFFTGDFNDDGYDDFGLCFYRGKYHGKMFISLNDKSGNFIEHKLFNIDGEAINFKSGDEVVSGDFNGDGLDDLMIRIKDRDEQDYLSFYLNNGQDKFLRHKILAPDDPLLCHKTWKKFFAGDFNGDDFDDLAVVYMSDSLKGKFIISLNNQNDRFLSPYILDTSFEGMEGNDKFTPLVMDINGDSVSDPGIYWQSGDRDAYWYFSINNGDGKGGKEFHAGFGSGHMAFMGNYLAYSGDSNGDGYDELLVKLGTSDEIAQWYLMQNRQDSSFAMGRSILFDGETDLIIR